MSVHQATFTQYSPPLIEWNPQLDLFWKSREDQPGVLAPHLWKQQEGILARSSEDKMLRSAATNAHQDRSSTRGTPLVTKYSWEWPSFPLLGGYEQPQSGVAPQPLSSLTEYRDEISQHIAFALSRPCPVITNGDSTRVELLGCTAWVVSAKRRAIYLEVRDENGEWQMSQIKFSIEDPLSDTLWLDQVLLPWISLIEQKFGDRAVDAHWLLRQNLQRRFHHPEYLRATSRQIRYHLDLIPGFTHASKLIRRRQPGLELDNETYSAFWAEEPVWSNLVEHYPHLVHFYHVARKEGLLRRGSGIGDLRKVCLQRGMSNAGWRFFSHFGESAYENLESCFPDSGLGTADLIGYIEWQARGGLKVPLPEVLGERVFATDCLHPDERLLFTSTIDPRVAQVILAHWQQMADDEANEWFINQELTEVLMWLRREKPVFDRNQWRAGWPAIHRCYLRCLKETPGELSWSPVLESFVIESWRIRPLTSSNDLALEGIRMRHCVAEYDESCHDGTCHIFTVEAVNTYEPAATISLAKSNSGWVVDQVKGKRNIDPCPEMQDIATKILEKLAARIDPAPKE